MSKQHRIDFEVIAGFAYKQLGPDYTESFLTTAGSVYALLSGLGAAFWHWLYFKFQVKVVLSVVAIGDVSILSKSKNRAYLPSHCRSAENPPQRS